MPLFLVGSLTVPVDFGLRPGGASPPAGRAFRDHGPSVVRVSPCLSIGVKHKVQQHPELIMKNHLSCIHSATTLIPSSLWFFGLHYARHSTITLRVCREQPASIVFACEAHSVARVVKQHARFVPSCSGQGADGTRDLQNHKLKVVLMKQ